MKFHAVLMGIVLLGVFPPFSTAEAAEGETSLFARENLVAWCIVPFDSKQRGPEARAEMLRRMGITHFAYDWRAEHIPQFDEEMETLKRWGITLSAFWFPGALDQDAQTILDLLKRHEIKTELWVSMNGGEIVCTPEEHQKRVEEHVAALRPIVEAAAAIGCKVGLYNHGGWFGEPENQLEILKKLNAPNVGLVYNLHHGHGHLDRFPQLLEQMTPYLYCLNLNGMTKDGEAIGEKILPLGSGDLDLGLLKTIAQSQYRGPIGILGHTMNDAEETLLDNLDGLDWLVAQLKGEDPGPRPPLRVGRVEAAKGVASLSPAFGKALSGSLLAEGQEAYRVPPITVECRARLKSKTGYNILVASDTKASGAHWEIFSEAGSGQLSVYVPGLEPDHVRTGRDICDGMWHQVTMRFAPDKITVLLDGTPVAEQREQSRGAAVVPGGLGIGRLVEGGFFCDGEIDDVRISKGIRSSMNEDPLTADGDTLGLWNFDELSEASGPDPDAYAAEDPERRAALPEFQVIPAAKPEELTPALAKEAPTQWFRSHGNWGNTRYTRTARLTKENVGELEVAWIYHSGDGAANVQCNPVVVDGVMYAPTSGAHVVALNAATGEELWRFKPGGKPAFRGLTYLHERDGPARLLFHAGDSLWALAPETGQPFLSFGEGGRVRTGEARVAPAVFENIVVVATYARDIAGYDLHSGTRLWTFRTIPEAGEFGADTWDDAEEGANCWGGMALDDARGIVFVSTGSPKPNFAGNTHLGQNLFSNCVIALDARTGARLWHFQELRHDLWDLDIPAPPNLLSVMHEGKQVDVVAQVTKLGNTLLLDRVTGKPLFPFRLRRAPVSMLPGERTWPYQPDVELPEPFARQAFSLEDVTERSQEAHDFVLAHVANARMGRFEVFEENRPTAFYNIHGGAEWMGAAVDPQRGRLYVTANNIPWLITVFRPDEVVRDPNAPPTPGEVVYRTNCVHCHGADRMGVGMNLPLQGLGRRLDDQAVLALFETGRNAMPAVPETVTMEERRALLDYLFLRDVPQESVREATINGRPRYVAAGYPKLLDPEGYPGSKPPWGTLNCLDLNTGKLQWQVPLGNYPDLADWGEDDTGAENFGGASITENGLIFCAGTPDAMLRAFDAENGRVLWERGLPFMGSAPPTLYQVAGKDYVVIPATGGGKLGTPAGDAYVAFALAD